MSLEKEPTERLEVHNKERMKKAFRDANKRIREEISKGLYVPTARAKMQADLMGDIITGSSFDEIRRTWKEASERIIKEGGSKRKLEELNALIGRFEKQLISITQITVRYITELRRMHGGTIDKEALLQMRDSTAFKARTLAKILLNPENTSVTLAIRYALKLDTQTKQRFREARAYLSNALASGGADYDKGEAISAWFIMNFLSQKEKEEIIAFHIKKENLTDEKLKKFLQAGSKHGTISPTLAKKFAVGKTSFTKGETYMMSTAYKLNHDFTQRAKRYFHIPYGSYNQFARMATGKNLALFLIKFSVAVSTGGTLVANIFKDEGWKHPEKVARIMTKKGMLLNYGLYALAKHLEKPTVNKFTPEGEKKTQEKYAAAYKMKSITEGNRGWGNFLTGQKFTGGIIFEQFVNEHGRRSAEKGKEVSKIPIYRRITMPAFVEWLKSKGQKDKRYSDLLQQINIDGGKYSVNGYETNNDEIRALARAFHVWDIGGTSAEKQYKEALRAAGGGAKKPSKKKQT